MDRKTRDGEDFVGTRRLPGTGGDFIDGNDVEGHRRAADDPDLRGGEGGEQIARRLSRREEIARLAGADDRDVEGHRLPRQLTDDAGPGELHRLPTTQGEFTRRGPGENPHGDR